MEISHWCWFDIISFKKRMGFIYKLDHHIEDGKKFL